MRRPFEVVLAVSAGLILAFLLLPILALFLRIPPEDLLSQLTSEVAVDALIVSVKTSVIAHAVVLLLGNSDRLPRRDAAFPRALARAHADRAAARAPSGGGRHRALRGVRACAGSWGTTLDAAGISIPFTQTAVVFAIIFVSSPFYIRLGIAAFEGLDPALIDASRTLGAGPRRTFFRVALPLAAGGLSAASALAFARGLGEFGATIMFAGSLQGVTQTLPLAIYAQLDIDFDIALALGAFLVVVSVAVLLTVKLLPSWTRFTLISLAPSGRSD